jgi:hypothetical protein
MRAFLNTPGTTHVDCFPHIASKYLSDPLDTAQLSPHEHNFLRTLPLVNITPPSIMSAASPTLAPLSAKNLYFQPLPPAHAPQSGKENFGRYMLSLEWNNVSGLWVS